MVDKIVQLNRLWKCSLIHKSPSGGYSMIDLTYSNTLGYVLIWIDNKR